MFTAFITAFCLGSAIMGALYILVPQGKMSKPVAYAFSLGFLCLMLSVTSVLESIKLPKIKNDSTSLNNERLSAAAAQTVFAEALAGAGINFSKITVFTDKTDTGSISITKVLVFTSAGYEKVHAVIGSESYEVVVIND